MALVSEGGNASEAAAAALQRSEWPAHLPPGCPLSCEGSAAVEGVVFRLSRGTAKDWESWSEAGRQSKHGECHAAGLSVFRDRAELEALRASFGYMRGRKISSATLVPSHGHIAKIPGDIGTHSSLWLRRDALAQYRTLFVVVE